MIARCGLCDKEATQLVRVEDHSGLLCPKCETAMKIKKIFSDASRIVKKSKQVV